MPYEKIPGKIVDPTASANFSDDLVNILAAQHTYSQAVRDGLEE